MGGFGRTSQFNDWNGIHEVVTWLVKSVNLKTTRRSNQFIAAYSNSQLYKYTGIIKRAIFKLLSTYLLANNRLVGGGGTRPIISLLFAISPLNYEKIGKFETNGIFSVSNAKLWHKLS